jgi:hypothetical protein
MQMLPNWCCSLEVKVISKAGNPGVTLQQRLQVEQ